jgi:hypothetical protein
MIAEPKAKGLVEQRIREVPDRAIAAWIITIIE